MTSTSPQGADHRLGESLATALASIRNPTPQMRQSVLLDLLGDDRSLWPALRQLIEQPGFEALRCNPSSAARMVGRDAWLQELATWCNQDSLARTSEFLNGLLDLQAEQVARALENEGTKDCSQDHHETLSATPSHASGRTPVALRSGTGNTSPNSTSQPGPTGDVKATIRWYCDRAIQAARRGETQAAIHFYTEAIHLDSTDAQLYWERGRAHATTGNLAEATVDFSSVLRLNPGNTEAMFSLGKIHAAAKELGAARYQIKNAADCGHTEARAWMADDCTKRAKAEAERNNHKHAAELITMAMSFRSAQIADYMLRARALIAQGNYEGALHDLSQVIKIDPGNATALAQRVDVMKALKRHNEAKADCQAASAQGHPNLKGNTGQHIIIGKRRRIVGAAAAIALICLAVTLTALQSPPWLMILAISLCAGLFTLIS